jgi:hypothetical protein
MSITVILSAAKDAGSLQGPVKRVNYRGSSPKMRAQNDSTSRSEWHIWKL